MPRKAIYTVSQLVDAVTAFKERHGYSPSVAELTTALGCKSTSGTYRIMERARSAGLLTFAAGEPRTIELIGARWLSPAEVRAVDAHEAMLSEALQELRELKGG